MSRQQVILDVDTGVDDALAIALALRSPELEVLGVTTVSGNVSVAQATRNTLLVLDALEAGPIPVVAGAAGPLLGAAQHAHAVHGADGIGGLSRALPPSARRAGSGAAEFLLERIAAAPDELVLIATAPLTNVAQAVVKDPGTMRRLRGLTVMGGAVGVPGNVTSVAEFNVWADPEAAAVVLGAGLPLTLVPLDVTERVVLTRGAMASASGPRASLIRDLTRETVEFHSREERVPGLFLHDPLAVGVVVDASLVQCEERPLDVERSGRLTRGMLVGDRRRRSAAARTGVRVCTGVDADRFLHLFEDRVLRGDEET